MSNGRQFRRSVGRGVERGVAAKNYEVRELSEDELNAVDEHWEHLTDQVVRSFHYDEENVAVRIANEGIDSIGEQYGGAALIVAPFLACRNLAEHALMHGRSLFGIRDGIDGVGRLHQASRKAFAVSVTAGILADTMGLQGAFESTVEWAVDSMEQGWPGNTTVVSGVWLAFCWAGAGAAVGVNWCDDPGCAETSTEAAKRAAAWLADGCLDAD